MGHICEELSRYGNKFSMDLYLRPQADARKVDFRFLLLDGIIPEPLYDDKKYQRYRQALLAEMGAMSQRLHDAAGHYCVETLAHGERLLAKSKRTIEATCPALPLSDTDMAWYLSIVLELRIWRMLDEHIRAGSLVINVLGGEEVVSLDNLVAWAVSLKITIEQDALPGCQSLVQAAYSRLHQDLAKVSLSTEGATADSPRPKHRWDEHELRRLWDKSLEPGMTQEKLAEHYGVSRQQIGKMLKKAEANLKFGTNKSSQSWPFHRSKR